MIGLINTVSVSFNTLTVKVEAVMLSCSRVKFKSELNGDESAIDLMKTNLNSDIST